MRIVFLALFLSGCASMPGVTITEEERKACEVQTCTVWTQQDLQGLIQYIFRQGYQSGQTHKGTI